MRQQRTRMALWGDTVGAVLLIVGCVSGTSGECTHDSDCADRVGPCQMPRCESGACSGIADPSRDGQACTAEGLTVCQTGQCAQGACQPTADPDKEGLPCGGTCSGELFWEVSRTCYDGACVTPRQPVADVSCGNGTCLVPGCEDATGCTSTLDLAACTDPSGQYLITMFRAKGATEPVETFGELTVGADASFTITQLEAHALTLQTEPPVFGRFTYNADGDHAIQLLDQLVGFALVDDEAGAALAGTPADPGLMLGVRLDGDTAQADLDGAYELLGWTVAPSVSGVNLANARLQLVDGQFTGETELVIYDYAGSVPPPLTIRDVSVTLEDGQTGRATLRATGPTLDGMGTTQYKWDGGQTWGGRLLLFPVSVSEGFGFAILVQVLPSQIDASGLAGTYSFVELAFVPGALGGDHYATTSGKTAFSGGDAATVTGTDGAGTWSVGADGAVEVALTSKKRLRLLVADASQKPARVLIGYEVQPDGAPERRRAIRIYTLD